MPSAPVHMHTQTQYLCTNTSPVFLKFIVCMCGCRQVYSDLPAEFGGSAGAEKKLVLPELGLKNPDDVIQTSVGKMRAKRQQEAPPLTPVRARVRVYVSVVE